MSADLRAPRPEDLADLVEILGGAQVRLGTMRLPYPTEAEVRALFLLGDGEGTARSIVAVLQDKVVGLVCLMPRRGRQGHMADLFLAVHDDFAGRGLGGQLMTAVLDLADNWLGLRRIYLEAAAENAAALALYEKHGFEREGLLRGDTMTEGYLADSIAMGRMRPGLERRGER